MPATSEADAIATELIRRIGAADPELAASIGLTDADGAVPAARLAVDLPRLVARSAPGRTMLVCAVSERAV